MRGGRKVQKDLTFAELASVSELKWPVNITAHSQQLLTQHIEELMC